MSTQKWEISALQAGMLVAGAVSITGHALAVTQFMRAGGRDAWMSGIVALPAAIIAVWSWMKLANRYPGKTVVEYAPKVLGYAGYLVAGLFLAYWTGTLLFTMRITTDWLVDSILPETPSWVMGTLYMVAIIYAAMGGLDALARVNQFTLPLLTFLGILVSVGTLQAKDYTLLTPFLEKGWEPVLAVTYLGLGYYGETSVLAMYSAYVVNKDRPKLLKSYLYSLLFVVVTLTGPLAGSTATLGYRVAANMPYPTFQHWLMVSVARFFERTDLLAVHQWLAGAYVRCALYLLMASHGICQVTGVKKKQLYVIAIVGALIVVAAELLFPTKPQFDEFILNVYLPAGAFLGIFAPPLLLAVDWVRGLVKQGQGVQGHGA